MPFPRSLYTHPSNIKKLKLPSHFLFVLPASLSCQFSSSDGGRLLAGLLAVQDHGDVVDSAQLDTSSATSCSAYEQAPAISDLRQQCSHGPRTVHEFGHEIGFVDPPNRPQRRSRGRATPWSNRVIAEEGARRGTGPEQNRSGPEKNRDAGELRFSACHRLVKELKERTVRVA